MNSTLTILPDIELDDEIVIYKENTYVSFESEYRDVFRQFFAEGKILSQYDDDLWVCFSGVTRTEIDFSFDEVAYMGHARSILESPVSMIKDQLKSYALSVCGSYIFRSVKNQIRAITRFLTHFGNTDYEESLSGISAITDFLVFVGKEDAISDVTDMIFVKKRARAKQRTMASMINYLAIDAEITDMYESGLSDAEFIQWFPIYFWCKITFVLPLRATEMIVTPLDCIIHRYDDVYLKVRRTKLKGNKGKKKIVCYEIEKDYAEFEYRVPNINAIRNIEKYQKLTANQNRKTLFSYGVTSTNRIYSLQSFNALLADFIEERLIGNHKYDYARYASGVKEFEVVTAGDSRPIAMSNLYYQDNGAEICRQLAGHSSINTSYGYYTNVSNTVLATSIMQLQRRLNYGYKQMERDAAFHKKAEAALSTYRGCISTRQPKITGDIQDCISENHLEECLGCRYYLPGEAELREELQKRRDVLDKATEAVAECMKKGLDDKGIDFDKVFLDAHSGITRFKTATDEKAQETFTKWQRHRDSMTDYS